MHVLKKIGWTDEFQRYADSRVDEVGDDVEPARISADFGMQYEVITASTVCRAQLSGKLRAAMDTPEATPAVGDWVLVRITADDPALVVDIIPRKSRLARQASGRRGSTRHTGMQIVGANLDLVFIVTSLNQEFSPRRLERYLIATQQGGAQPVIVLSKADLVEDLSPFLRQAHALSAGAPVIITDAPSGEGIDAIETLLTEGKTGAFVGSSGVGKSTLVNLLIGQERQAVAGIRVSDDRGRHTTTHRQLISLPGGGVIIDTPGMREFHLWEGEAVDDIFEDIAELAARCRFRDCSHNKEPGCAVRAALKAGELTSERLESYRKLSSETVFTKKNQR